MEKKSLSTASSEIILSLVKQITEEVNNSGITGINFTFKNFVQHNAQENERGVKLVLQGTVSNKLASQVKALKEKVTKILEEYTEDSLNFRVSTTYNVGEKFPTVENLLVVPTKETKTFTHTPGEVVLVDFWATWCGPCQKPMAHNAEMLEKNHENWAGKARIVCISLDDEYETLEERINSKRWDKLENYQAAGGWESGAAGQFGIRGIPTVMLVDKNGYIRFRGHPSECKLEERINELINEADGAYNPDGEKKEETENENGEQEEANGEKKEITFEEEIAIFKNFEENFETIKSRLSEEKRFYFGLDFTRTFLPKPSQNAEAYFEATTTEEGRAVMIEVYRKLFKPLPSSISTWLQVSIPKKHSIKYGTSCATCKKALGKTVPHYVCTKCQCEGLEDHAFCADCANQEMTHEIDSCDKLFHPHGLAFLNEKSETSLDNINRLYNNCKLFTEEDPDTIEVKKDKNIGGYYCDDCGEKVKNYRWGCAQCRDFDFCDKCFQISINPEHEKFQSQKERMKEKAGHEETHFFYRQHYLGWLSCNPPERINFAEATKDD